MTKKYEQVVKRSQKILDLLAKEELTEEEKAWVVQETIEGFRDHINPGFLKYRKSVSSDYAVVEWRDEGSAFMDIYGRTFIDCLGGYGTYNVGHRHPKVLQAVFNQLNRLALNSHELLDSSRAFLAKLIADICPGDLEFVFLCNSGAEAVEGALKLARLHTGRKGYIAATGAFHGKTMGALSATAKAVFREPFLPLIPGFRHVPFGDAEALRKEIECAAVVGEDIAAVILEPVQGEGGINVAPEGYFAQVRKICDESGVLFIADEVQTGMGRTGKMFAMEHYEVIPDIMCLSKSLGGGVMPVGAFVSTKEIWQKLVDPTPYLHTSTFGGNGAGCAAAIAAINVILEEGLCEQAASKGEYFLSGLLKLAQQYPQVCRSVRGLGLLIGMEFTDNNIGYQFAKGLFDHDVLVAGTLINARVIRFEPPLNISYAEIDTVIKIAEKVIKQIQDSM